MVPPTVALKSPHWLLDELATRSVPQSSMVEFDASQRSQLVALVAGTYRKDRMTWDAAPPSV
ncbi:MAG: hypothetical protein RL318_839 [Fibrobacterota bacterium]